jgi:UDP-GlcNAc:undecaprenyl-phosphate GlcNAc-1-phosphate transferase
MREYVVVLLTAGLVTYLATPVVRLAAVRLRMMAAPRERDVHVIPTPRGGGVAMYLGVAAAILVATRLPALQRTFDDSQTTAVLVAGGLICALGVIDDKFGLDALTKLTGQIAAAGVMVLIGVQLAYVFLPVADIGTLSLGPDIGVPLTICWPSSPSTRSTSSTASTAWLRASRRSRRWRSSPTATTSGSRATTTSPAPRR